jgi:hypothetical protein
MTLNDKEYKGGEITAIGNSKIIVNAVDKAGNHSTFTVNSWSCSTRSAKKKENIKTKLVIISKSK